MLQVVDVELTPNPNALKFLINERLLKHAPRQYFSIEEAANDPLAKGIFALGGINSVFYMDKFITIGKAKDADWGKIQRPLVDFLSHFDKSQLLAEESASEEVPVDGELYKKIVQVLNERVRPALAFDGGGLEVMGLEGHTLKVRYQGACGSCPSAISGTLIAIESVLQRYVDPNIEVTAG